MNSIKKPALVVTLCVAMAVAAIFAGCSDADAPTTTGPVGSTTTSAAASSTSTTETPQSSSSTTAPTTSSTSTTVQAGPAGDSPGTWTDVDVPETGGRALWVGVSDDALLIQSEAGGGVVLSAYLFGSQESIELPTESPQVTWADIDGTLAVWSEGRYDEATASFQDQRVFAYRLPDGPRVEVAGAPGAPASPQVAGGWITWVEMSAPEGPYEEYRRMSISGVEIDASGKPVGQAAELVPSAIASVVGDSVWTYSLSSTKLAWEQHLTADGIDAGSYLLDLTTREKTRIGTESWRPSLSEDVLVYSEDGLKSVAAGGEAQDLDPLGDFAAAAPTFATYFRTSDDGGYEIVARGLTESYEQVLGQASEPPWLAASIAVSDHYVAFIVDGVAKLFAWEG